MTQMGIEDVRLGGIPVCRGFDYFVNPLSTSTTELGTIEHPYKELNSVFVELFHFHSHSDRQITIHLYQDTTNYVREGTYLLNITNVKIISYSLEELQTRKAKIVAIESESTNSPQLLPSQFILLSSSAIDYSSSISSDSKISSEDKALLTSSGNPILYLYKCGITLENVYMATEYTSLSVDKVFISPVQMGSKLLQIRNSKVMHEGRFLATQQQMSLEVIGSEFDLHKSQGGFYLQLSCIQGQQALGVMTKVENTKFYFSQDPSDLITTNFPPFVQYGGQDISFFNVTLMFYGDSGSNGYNFLLRPDQT